MTDNATDKAVIRRIQKLLRLSKSDNPNEAANAAAEAARLMDRHRLSMARIEAEGGESDREPIGEETIEEKGKRVTWRGSLLYAIAEHGACRMYWWYNGMRLVGRPTDRLAVKLLYEFVGNEIERLSRDAVASRPTGWGGARTFGNNFRLGAVATVRRRLAEMAQERQDFRSVEDDAEVQVAPEVQEKALVLVRRDAEALDVFYRDLSKKLKLRKVARKSAYSHEARRAGERAGEKIHLGKCLGEGDGRRQLEGCRSGRPCGR